MLKRILQAAMRMLVTFCVCSLVMALIQAAEQFNP